MAAQSRSSRGVIAPAPESVERLFRLEPRAIFRQLAREPFAVWAILGYMFTEYVRPQSIIPGLDVLPWAKLFIYASFGALVVSPKARWVSDATNLWMVLFLVVLIASGVLAIWPSVAREHWFDFVGWFVIYFLVINIITTEERFMLVLLLFIAASFKLSFFGARTWAMRGFSFTSWGLMGPPGFFTNSGELAVQMAVFTPIAYAMLVGLRSRISRNAFRALLIVPVTGVMTILGASSRGSQLALGVQLVKTVGISAKRARAIFAMLLLAVVAWFALPEAQKERFSTAGEDDTSRQRLLYWQGGIEMIKERPLLGVGFFNFAPYYQLRYSDKLLMREAQLPHNIFIQIGTDAGVIGLMVYLMLIYSAFRCTRDARKRARRLPHGEYYITLARGLDTAFIGYLLAGQFVTIGYYPYMWIHLAIVVSLNNVLSNSVRAMESATVKRNRTSYAMAIQGTAASRLDDVGEQYAV